MRSPSGHLAGFAQNVGGLDRGLFPSYDIPPADAGSDRISRTASLGSLSVCTDLALDFLDILKKVLLQDATFVSNLANTVLCRATWPTSHTSGHPAAWLRNKDRHISGEAE